LIVTRTGGRLHAAIWPIAEATVDEALSELSAEERRRLTRTMSRVKAKLQALVEHDPAIANSRSAAADNKEARAL
jgi:hypothetical protein